MRIISGPFAEFVGDITEVYPDKERQRLSVSSIFGRDTPVELEYSQIQKKYNYPNSMLKEGTKWQKK
ncbi:MAG: hypothetical protein MZU97_02535 [Bacillus subtilis]|nr:hypothetical protein [Bacillus subtilis]